MTDDLKAALEACRALCRGCDRDEPGCDSSICKRCHNTGYTIPPAVMAMALAVREEAAELAASMETAFSDEPDSIARAIRAIDLGDKEPTDAK